MPTLTVAKWPLSAGYLSDARARTVSTRPQKRRGGRERVGEASKLENVPGFLGSQPLAFLREPVPAGLIRAVFGQQYLRREQENLGHPLASVNLANLELLGR